MNTIISFIFSGITLVSSFFGINNLEDKIVPRIEKLEEKTESISFAGFSPTGGLTYRLQSSVATTDTSITLSSFKNRSDIPLTMSLLGTDILYGTIDPQTSRSEFVSCTGITQNTNGTATLTSCTRGLSDIGSSVASTTLRRSHPGQSVFILSDSPALFSEYTKHRSNEWITGVWGFQTAATTSDVCSSAEELCNKQYVDSVAVAGASDANETTKGIIELATAIEQASSTSAGSTAALLVTRAAYSTSSPVRGCNSTSVAGALCNVIAGNDGKINRNFIATSSDYRWTGNNTFASTTFANGTTTLSATTTISANSSNKLFLNGLPYTIAGARSASSTTLAEDGNGNLTFVPLTSLGSAFFIQATSSDTTHINTAAERTVASFSTSVPGGIMGTTGAIEVEVYVSLYSESSGNNTASMAMKLGGNTVCNLTMPAPGTSGGGGVAKFTFFNVGSASSNTCASSYLGSTNSSQTVGTASNDTGTSIDTNTAQAVTVTFTSNETDQTFRVTAATLKFLGRQ